MVTIWIILNGPCNKNRVGSSHRIMHIYMAWFELLSGCVRTIDAQWFMMTMLLYSYSYMHVCMCNYVCVIMYLPMHHTNYKPLCLIVLDCQVFYVLDCLRWGQSMKVQSIHQGLLMMILLDKHGKLIFLPRSRERRGSLSNSWEWKQKLCEARFILRNWWKNVMNFMNFNIGTPINQ